MKLWRCSMFYQTNKKCCKRRIFKHCVTWMWTIFGGIFSWHLVRISRCRYQMVPGVPKVPISQLGSIRIRMQKSLGKENLPNMSQKVGVVFWRQGRTQLNRPNLCPWCSGCCFVHEHPFWFFFGNVRTRNGANVKPKAVCFLCYCYLATTSMDKI